MRKQVVVALAALTSLGAMAVITSVDSNEPPASPQGQGKVVLDGPIYPSTTALAQNADVIIRGEYTSLIASGDEGALLGAATSAGLPVQIWDVHVAQSVSGDITSSSVAVLLPDSDHVEEVDSNPSNGTDSLLFLRATGKEFNGTQIYTTVGISQGDVRLETNNGEEPVAGDSDPASLAKEIDADSIEEIEDRAQTAWDQVNQPETEGAEEHGSQ